jgi:hypothetical protein
MNSLLLSVDGSEILLFSRFCLFVLRQGLANYVAQVDIKFTRWPRLAMNL